MEEQKINSKEIKMKPMAKGKQDNTKQPEFTKEQLKEIADKLFNENKFLRRQLQQAQEFTGTINRLDYLLKVVEIASNSSSRWQFTDEFVFKCIEEIEKIMTPPEDTKTTEANKES